jgi:hypothetical protein
MDTNDDVIAPDDAMAFADQFDEDDSRDTLGDYGFNHETSTATAMEHEAVMFVHGCELLTEENEPYNPDYL